MSVTANAAALQPVNVDFDDTEATIIASGQVDLYGLDLSLGEETTLQFLDADDNPLCPAQTVLSKVLDPVVVGGYAAARMTSTNGLKIALGTSTTCVGQVLVTQGG